MLKTTNKIITIKAVREKLDTVTNFQSELKRQKTEHSLHFRGTEKNGKERNGIMTRSHLTKIIAILNLYYLYLIKGLQST